MEILRDLKTITLPWTTKAAAIALLFVAVAVNLAIFGYGWIHHRNEVIAATLQLFGAMLPVLLVVIVLARADSGVKALQRRTEALFSGVVPDALARIAERPAVFYTPDRRRAPQPASTGKVFVNLQRGDCHGDILVFTPWEGAWKAMVLRLEVNVLRVNVNLCIPRSLLPATAKAAKAALSFRHTRAGAAAASEHGENSAANSGYQFLEEGLVRTVCGVEFFCLVGSKFVGDEFLWDSAQQLYFAQDLMFMLRAFLAESPHLFPTLIGDAPPTGFADLARALGAAEERA